MSNNRAISVDNLLSKKFKVLDFDGEWKEFMGKPERSGCWFVWGNSGNGKTTFLLSLAKYLCRFDRVLFDSLEEGTRLSLQMAAERVNIKEVRRRLTFLHRESIEELKERLRKHKSQRIVFIDSYQYTGLNKKTFMQLMDEFPNHLFIFNSHAEGKQPEGRSAKSIRYHADVKIWVEGYRAIASPSRYGGGKPFTIWEEGAKKYYNEID